jgi:hypothetical protein
MTRQFLAANTDLDAGGMTLREMLWGVPAIYHAPLFQRRYVWGQRQFDQLWGDIDAVVDGVVKTRFLGAMVLEDISTGLPGRPAEYLIVDGQQRLTTLYLLLIALAELAAQLPDGKTLAEDIVESGLLNTVPHARGVPKIATTLRDRAQFHAVASRLGNLTALPVSPPLPYKEQTGELARMFDRVRAKLDREAQLAAAESAVSVGDEEAVNPPEGLEDLGAAGQQASQSARALYLEALYAVILDRLKFVGIRLGADDDPHQVFDRLNSAGIKLGVSDLVRNEVFSRLSKDPEAAQALADGPWANFEGDLGGRFDDYIFTYGLISKPSITKGSLLGELRGRWGAGNGKAQWTAAQILQDMNRLVPAFLSVASPDPLPATAASNKLAPPLRGQVERLRRMPIPSSVYPYAAMVVQSVLDGALAVKDAERDLLLVESFLVRRAFAGLEPTGLHAVFKSMWQEAGGSPSKLVDAIDKRKTIRFPSDDEFADNIRRRGVYGMRLLPYVLRAYDESLPGDNPKSGSSLTIDHVMPQKPGAGWSVAKLDHARVVDTWGNLVPLSGPGNSSKNAQPWGKVYQRLKTESQWKTTKALAISTSTWGPVEIEARAEELAKWALGRWPRKR